MQQLAAIREYQMEACNLENPSMNTWLHAWIHDGTLYMGLYFFDVYFLMYWWEVRLERFIPPNHAPNHTPESYPRIIPRIIPPNHTPESYPSKCRCKNKMFLDRLCPLQITTVVFCKPPSSRVALQAVTTADEKRSKKQLPAPSE